MSGFKCIKLVDYKIGEGEKRHRQHLIVELRVYFENQQQGAEKTVQRGIFRTKPVQNQQQH
jgi:hypothetical protein